MKRRWEVQESLTVSQADCVPEEVWMTVAGPGAERQRIDGFGRLDLGLRQASDWYLWRTIELPTGSGTPRLSTWSPRTCGSA